MGGGVEIYLKGQDHIPYVFKFYRLNMVVRGGEGGDCLISVATTIPLYIYSLSQFSCTLESLFRYTTHNCPHTTCFTLTELIFEPAKTKCSEFNYLCTEAYCCHTKKRKFFFEIMNTNFSKIFQTHLLNFRKIFEKKQEVPKRFSKKKLFIISKKVFNFLFFVLRQYASLTRFHFVMFS